MSVEGNGSDVPWPDYPCCSCRIENHPMDWAHHQRDPWYYPEGSGYYWHSAYWNVTTGRWWAICCNGHKRKEK